MFFFFFFYFFINPFSICRSAVFYFHLVNLKNYMVWFLFACLLYPGQVNNWDNRIWLSYHKSVLKLHSSIYTFRSSIKENIKRARKQSLRVVLQNSSSIPMIKNLINHLQMSSFPSSFTKLNSSTGIFQNPWPQL